MPPTSPLSQRMVGSSHVSYFIAAIDGHFAWSERVSARISTCG